jgi:RNA polymerase sigma-70 factor (ECF subfamily)
MINYEATQDGGNYLGKEVDITCIAARFYSALYRFAVYLTRSETDAADLVQETFLVLTRRSHQIRDFSQIKCWLFTTLRREFIRTIRRRKKYFEVEFLPDIHNSPTSDLEPWQSLDARIVLDALLRVNERYRATLKLFYLSELSYKEIAETLGMPIGTVMSRLSRGKEQLKSILRSMELTLPRHEQLFVHGEVNSFFWLPSARVEAPGPFEHLLFRFRHSLFLQLMLVP